jgi:hypothetical protein
VNALRTLLLGETWALSIGVCGLALLSIAADLVGPDWWPSAGGPLMLAGTTMLVTAAVWRTSRR